MEHNGQPTVILAKTIKGYGLGPHFAGRNATHQMKKLTLDDLKRFRDALRIPITRRAARGQPLPAAVLPPGRRRRRRSSTCASAAARSAARCRSAGSQHKPLELPGD